MHGGVNDRLDAASASLASALTERRIFGTRRLVLRFRLRPLPSGCSLSLEHAPGALYDSTEYGLGLSGTAQGLEALLIEGHGVALLKNPVSSAFRLADMATRIEATRALLERAAHAVDEDAPDAEALCNMAKLFASEEILKVAQHAVELHGGNGMMLDFGVEKLLRDAAIFLHMDATVDISKMKIVKSMFPATAGKYAGPE
jgi:hypothetical protein